MLDEEIEEAVVEVRNELAKRKKEIDETGEDEEEWMDVEDDSDENWYYITVLPPLIYTTNTSLNHKQALSLLLFFALTLLFFLTGPSQQGGKKLEVLLFLFKVLFADEPSQKSNFFSQVLLEIEMMLWGGFDLLVIVIQCLFGDTHHTCSIFEGDLRVLLIYLSPLGHFLQNLSHSSLRYTSWFISCFFPLF